MLTSTAGVNFKPSGLSVTQLFRFIHSCLEAKSPEMQAIILNNKVLDKLLSLFLASSGNNVLQNQFAAIVKLVIDQKAGVLFEYVPFLLPRFSSLSI